VLVQNDAATLEEILIQVDLVAWEELVEKSCPIRVKEIKSTDGDNFGII
jgi:hypothetical protein